MAISLKENLTLLEVISSVDDAVRCSPEKYTEYLKTLDESLLELDENIVPTRFVLNCKLSYTATQSVKRQQMKIDKSSGEMEIDPSFYLEEIRLSLCDIKTPGEGLEFKADKQGFAERDLIAKLDRANIVMELFAALSNMKASQKDKLKKS